MADCVYGLAKSLRISEEYNLALCGGMPQPAGGRKIETENAHARKKIRLLWMLI